MSGYAARRLAAFVAVALLTCLAPTTSAAGAGPATLSFDIDPTLPIQVSRTPGLPETIGIDVLATAPVEDVTVSVSGPGLSLGRTTYTLEEVTPQRPGYVPLGVTADTGGLHTLTLTASAPGVAPARIELPYVFSSGGPRLPGADSLAGRAYAAQGDYVDYSTGESGSGARYSSVVTFVDDTHATYGLPGHLETACAGRGGRCLPYSYDASTGLVQVGDQVIGQLDSGPAYVDGLTPAVYQDTGQEFEGERYRRLVLPAAGARYAGTWAFRSPFTADGVYVQRLTLRRGGTYTLSVRAGVGFSSSYEGGAASFLKRDWSGRYRVGPGGRLTLRDARNRATYTVARLALGATDAGRAQGRKLGVELQLTLKVEKGKEKGSTVVDGNLLAFRP